MQQDLEIKSKDDGDDLWTNVASGKNGHIDVCIVVVASVHKLQIDICAAAVDDLELDLKPNDTER